MGERKKISLTELDESSIVASFKEERPAQAVPLAVEPETPYPTGQNTGYQASP